LRPSLKIRHGDANFLCTFFSMMIPLPLIQAWKSWNQKQILTTLIFTLISIFFVACAFLTESRMGLIAIAIGLAYLLIRPKWPFSKGKLIASLTIFLVIILAVNGERIFQRFADIQDKSNTDRYLTWQNGWQVFTDNPIVGAGMHKVKYFFYQNTHYPMFQSEFNPLEVHNTFLSVAAELGIIGLIFFMIFFLWPWKTILRLTDINRYFLISSMIILTLSIMTIGLVYKDLFILHLYIIAALATTTPTIEPTTC
jgi:putative inorganic carbon (HCO3(-)) transporter